MKIGDKEFISGDRNGTVSKMKNFIKEIFSDTTITKIDFENSVLKVYLTFYTEEKYLITFENVLGYKVDYRCELPEGIESVQIESDTSYLIDVLKTAENDISPTNNHKCYSFISSNEAVVEIISSNYTLKKLE